MIVIALPNKVKDANRLVSPKARWCYLGKDITKRETISRALGEARRFFLSSRLQKKAEELGQSYIEYVARLGKVQRDQLNWWASKFASKRFMHTDFFLLVCYKAIAADLVREIAVCDELIIFVEDPWLFSDLKALYGGRDGIEFLGRPNLFLTKFLCIVRGIIHRLLLVAWMPLAHTLILCYHRGVIPKALESGRPVVGIINPAERRAFKDEKYLDNYLSGLTALYEKNGIDSFHLYLVRFPLSTAKYVGINRGALWPLILDVKFPHSVKRIFEYWKPIVDVDIGHHIGECGTILLLERERWLEISSAGFNVHLILFDAFDRFFQKGWCRSIIYTFENQPWEKMLCMAASKNGIRTIGYQHSSIWRLYLAQFIGKGEKAFVPLPHRIVTSGSLPAELYIKGGIPQERIVVGGAWRYCNATGRITSDGLMKKGSDSKPIALVALSLDISISQSMLENMTKAIARNRLEDDIKLWVKPHPGNTPYELGKLKALISRYKVVNLPFDALLKEADIVVSSESTAGLEAFLNGKKAISYIPENLLAADPLLDITDDRAYRWYEGEDIDTRFLKDQPQMPISTDIAILRRGYFDNIKHMAWIEAVST